MDTSREPLGRIPTHVAMIMDGNGRWAKARGLPRLAGHRAGTENLRRILEASMDFGIRIVTIYAFSTENWGRPQEEVQGLLQIFSEMLDNETRKLHEKGVRVTHLGGFERMPARLVDKLQRATDLTKDNQKMTLNVALNYGGRADIVQAVRRIMAAGVPPEQVTEELIGQHLYTAGQPDPDLVIRTAGEMRLSNFLIWQNAYAEYYSTPAFWPDFDREELYKALLAYSQRDRRYGKVKQ